MLEIMLNKQLYVQAAYFKDISLVAPTGILNKITYFVQRETIVNHLDWNVNLVRDDEHLLAAQTSTGNRCGVDKDSAE